MQYQVLARKWRPQNFHEIVGQEYVAHTLLNALKSGRLAHAFLLSGPRGSGKTTTARVLAKAINCHAGQPGEPCGKCPACTEIAAGNCMDVMEIDAASNTGVDNVRDLIEQVQYLPARDRNKVFIIDEVHMLSNAAFNALLKTLEEPPPHVVFIMATTEYHKIPATILSRCQQYSFKLIQYPLILERLKYISREEKIRISDAALEQVVFSSGGSMRDAMSALDQVIAFSGSTVRDEDIPMLLGLIEPAVLGKTVRAIAANETETLLKVVSDLVESGQDLENFCRRLLGQFRNLMVLKSGVADPALLGVPESHIPDLRSQAEHFSREDLIRLFEACLRMEDDLRRGTQKRFVLEMSLVELGCISRMRSLEDLIADFEATIQRDESTAPPGCTSGVTAVPTAVPPTPRADSSRGPVRVSGGPLDTPAAPRMPTTPPERPAEPASPAETTLPVPDVAAKRSRDLLQKIATATQKESLESLMYSLAGAEVDGDHLTIDLGSVNEFVCRQVRENLPLITQAAARVLGRQVRVQVGNAPVPTPAEEAPSPGPAAGSPQTDPLERAQREPVVRSFLDVFPGPVKAENLDK